jgi:hypothetical protein
MRPFSITLLSLLIFSQLPAKDQLRTWTNTDGVSLRATVVKVQKDSVTFRHADGRVFDYPLNKLTEENRKLLAQIQQQIEASAFNMESLNKPFSMNIWSKQPLWEESANEVASRMGLPKQSQTSTSSSFRRYPDHNSTYFKSLGARPYSIVMHAENNNPVSISMVFANKGDTSGDYSMQIDLDGKTIQANLTKLIGDPKRDYSDYGRYLRWDIEDTTFLLAVERNEYVSLQIIPTKSWSTSGTPHIPFEVMRKQVEERVVRKENGDIYIKDIPMVDQGPKGYCVPATFERILGYYSIPSDMYILAMVGKSQAGGGTNLGIMEQNLRREVRRNGRRWLTRGSRIDIKEIKRYIDQGTPILWGLTVYEDLNSHITMRSYERTNAKDLPSWAKENRPKNKRDLEQSLRKQEGTRHICMIIGYNPLTQEIAISDSWGPAYEIRWIFEEEMAALCTSNYHIISP